MEAKITFILYSLALDCGHLSRWLQYKMRTPPIQRTLPYTHFLQCIKTGSSEFLATHDFKTGRNSAFSIVEILKKSHPEAEVVGEQNKQSQKVLKTFLQLDICLFCL